MMLSTLLVIFVVFCCLWAFCPMPPQAKTAIMAACIILGVVVLIAVIQIALGGFGDYRVLR